MWDCPVRCWRASLGLEHGKTPPASTPCLWNAPSQCLSHVCLHLRPRSEGLTQLTASPSLVFWRRSRCGSGEAARGWLGPGAELPSCGTRQSGLQIGIRCGQLPPLNAALRGCLGWFCSAWRGGGGFGRVAGAQGGLQGPPERGAPLGELCFPWGAPLAAPGALLLCLFPCLSPCLCRAGAGSSRSRDDAGAGGWHGEDQV